MSTATDWHIYRTRFLIRARQLTSPLVFTDALGREHHGKVGDYLVESSVGLRHVISQKIFEDVYVAMGPDAKTRTKFPPHRVPLGELDRRVSASRTCSA